MARTRASRAPTEIDKIVGERIRAERIRQDVTMQELGEQLGISHQQLQKYETGTNRLSAGMLWKVAAAQGCTMESYFPFELIGQPRQDGLADLREAANALVDEVGKRVKALNSAARNVR